MNDPWEAANQHERRTFERVRLRIPGQLFNPAGDRELDCRVLDLSASGAAVECDGHSRPGGNLVLYVTGFGRFEGSTIRHEKRVLRLAFVIGKSKQNRLKDMLSLFFKEGLKGITDLRRHRRTPSIAAGFIVRADSQLQKCDVLDISMEGISLRVRTRAPIGELVKVGRNCGKVVRHHQEGVGIQFVQIPDASI